MTRLRKILIALDQLLGTLFLRDCYPDETISAYVFRKRRYRWIKLINWLFNDPNHCRQSYESEQYGWQIAPEYRAKFDEESQ